MAGGVEAHEVFLIVALTPSLLTLAAFMHVAVLLVLQASEQAGSR
jgi:uncharacterized membrane protein